MATRCLVQFNRSTERLYILHEPTGMRLQRHCLIGYAMKKHQGYLCKRLWRRSWINVFKSAIAPPRMTCRCQAFESIGEIIDGKCTQSPIHNSRIFLYQTIHEHPPCRTAPQYPLLLHAEIRFNVPIGIQYRISPRSVPQVSLPLETTTKRYPFLTARSR
ncbi:hypothetical protein SAMN05660226_04074 [Parapedobacter luteus]|uniref:Uncharacterized protein n=1 Tax=Parapedobacter luteus TaxID=623280 RepID=A0A1T5FLI3_9SPHI|nr:hypothetical protein SAMN05660226_04074 [Parapedobacter luteus]